MDPGTDEQRILAWLTSARQETTTPLPAPAEPAPTPAADPAVRAERSRTVKAHIRQLHTSTLTRRIRTVAPRLSAARAAEHAAAWSAILTNPEHLDDWLEAGLRVQDHGVAARCIHSEVTPAQLRPLRRNTELLARLRGGADPRSLLTE